MAVRSTRLGMATVSPGATLSVYTVPTGFTAILKNVWLNNGEAAANPVQLHVHPALAGPEIYIATPSLTAAESKEINTWIVLEQGDQLLATSLSGTFRVWASGAELPGT